MQFATPDIPLGVIGGALGALVWAFLGWVNSGKPFDLRLFLATSVPAALVAAASSAYFTDFTTPFLIGALGKSFDEKTVNVGDRTHAMAQVAVKPSS